jgi:hypothetical protein
LEGERDHVHQPPGTIIIGTFGPTTTNTNYDIALNLSAVVGELGQHLSLGMDSNSSDGLDLNSREAGITIAPRLVITVKK